MMDTASTTTVMTSSGTKSNCAARPTNPARHGSADTRSATRRTDEGRTAIIKAASRPTSPTRTSVATRSNDPPNGFGTVSPSQCQLSHGRKFAKGPNVGRPTRTSLICPATTFPSARSTVPPTAVTSPLTSAFGPRWTDPATATTFPSTLPSMRADPRIATTSSPMASSSATVTSPPKRTRAPPWR